MSLPALKENHHSLVEENIGMGEENQALEDYAMEDDIQTLIQEPAVDATSIRITFLEEELKKTREVVGVLMETVKSVLESKPNVDHQRLKIQQLEQGNAELKAEINVLKERMLKAETNIVLFDEEAKGISIKENAINDVKRSISNLDRELKRKTGDITDELRNIKRTGPVERAEGRIVNKRIRNNSGGGPLVLCRVDVCRNPLSRDLPLRRDGVSVDCPCCKWPTIIYRSAPGNKWVWLTCDHYQQAPASMNYGTEMNCVVCGLRSKVDTAASSLAKFIP